MMGTEQPWLSIERMAAWTGVYLAMLAVGGGIGFAVRDEPRKTRLLIALVLAAAIAATIALSWSRIPWRGFLRPLPVAMLAILIGFGVKARGRTRSEAARFVLPICFTVLSGALLAKIALNAHSYHYGFALAMPATTIFVA